MDYEKYKPGFEDIIAAIDGKIAGVIKIYLKYNDYIEREINWQIKKRNAYFIDKDDVRQDVYEHLFKVIRFYDIDRVLNAKLCFEAHEDTTK